MLLRNLWFTSQLVTRIMGEKRSNGSGGPPKKKKKIAENGGTIVPSKPKQKTNEIQKKTPISKKKNVEMKRNKKNKKILKKNKNVTVSNEKEIEHLPAVRRSDEPVEPVAKWTNKTKVLVFCSRGVTSQGRHLMDDIRSLMPHSKSDTKLDRKDQLFVINEICEMKNCRKCIFFEAKKKTDLYMWISCTPQGPSAKFLVENVHTMLELKMTGNCLKGSRPLLSFDKTFDAEPHWQLLKEMFIQLFSTPNYHPKSKPFIDHVLTFSIADGRIWFRNFQIIEENGELVEIGPRMVLNPIRLFKGSFVGETIYQNPNYRSPNEVRSLVRKMNAGKYMNRVEAKKSCEDRRPEQSYEIDPTSVVFRTD